MVGAGRWGINHIKTLDKLGSLGGIVDNDTSILNDLRVKYKYCSTFNNLDEALDANFDGYIVSTPPKSHYEISKKIIEHSKPVLVEKPITLKLEDARKLNELAKTKNVNLMVGHLLLFHPAFNKIKQMINDNILGEIQYIYSNRLNMGRFRKDENVLWSFAPHDIALFNYFFNDTPSSISASGIDILQEGIHDTSITSFKYPKNRMGHIFVSWLHPFKEHRFILIGSKGMIHFEDAAQRKSLIFYDKTVDFKNYVPKSKSRGSYEIGYDKILPLEIELKYFMSKIKSGKIEIANGDSAVNVMEILDKTTKILNEF